MFVIYYLEKKEKTLTLGQDSEETDVCRASSRTSSTQQQNLNARQK